MHIMIHVLYCHLEVMYYVLFIVTHTQPYTLLISMYILDLGVLEHV